MKKPQFVNGETYHIFNRGANKAKVFLEELDYLRFIHDLFEFNDTKPAPAPSSRLKIRKPSKVTVQHFRQLQRSEVEPRSIRNLLVEISTWCIMPNHFHLLVRQLVEGGIILFMRKLGTGYAMYFNQKYQRSGVVFQGRFKAVLVNEEGHFLHLPFYINANPLDLIEHGWRIGKIHDLEKAKKFLETYRYSGHLDLLGRKNFPSVSQRDFLTDIFKTTENYKKQFCDWLDSLDEKQIEKFADVILD